MNSAKLDDGACNKDVDVGLLINYSPVATTSVVIAKIKAEQINIFHIYAI